MLKVRRTLNVTTEKIVDHRPTAPPYFGSRGSCRGPETREEVQSTSGETERTKSTAFGPSTQGTSLRTSEEGSAVGAQTFRSSIGPQTGSTICTATFGSSLGPESTAVRSTCTSGDPQQSSPQHSNSQSGEKYGHPQ